MLPIQNQSLQIQVATSSPKVSPCDYRISLVIATLLAGALVTAVWVTAGPLWGVAAIAALSLLGLIALGRCLYLHKINELRRQPQAEIEEIQPKTAWESFLIQQKIDSAENPELLQILNNYHVPQTLDAPLQSIHDPVPENIGLTANKMIKIFNSALTSPNNERVDQFIVSKWDHHFSIISLNFENPRSGSYGAVYKCYDLATATFKALKCFSKDYTKEDSGEKVKKEALNLKILGHKNAAFLNLGIEQTIKVAYEDADYEDSDEDDEVVYSKITLSSYAILTDWYEINLEQMLQKNIAIERRIELIFKLLEAYSEGTGNGQYWHGDLKPENICYNEKENKFILSDAATLQSSSEKKPLYGTELYVLYVDKEGSPGVKVDIFSLGILFFEILTGEPPTVLNKDQAEKNDYDIQALSNIESIQELLEDDSEWNYLKTSKLEESTRKKLSVIMDLIPNMLLADYDERISFEELYKNLKTI